MKNGTHLFEDVIEGLRYKRNHVPAVNGHAMFAEELNAQYKVDSAYRTLVVSKDRKLNYRHMIAEALFNLTTVEIAIMQRYNKQIVRFVEDQPLDTRYMARWAYHPALESGLIKAVEQLRQDRSTRRASLIIPTDQMRWRGTPPCLTSMQFIYRGDQLHAKADMRSNDAWLGLPLDIFQFSLYQQLVADAIGLGVECGSYTHAVTSLHIYQDQADLVQAFCVPHRSSHWGAYEAEENMGFKLLPGAWNQFVSGKLGHDVRSIAAHYDDDPAWEPMCDPQRGFGPLLSVLRGRYENAPPIFYELKSQGIGIGW